MDFTKILDLKKILNYFHNKKKEGNLVNFSTIKDFNGKFFHNSKIIGGKEILLSHSNPFFQNNLNGKAEKFLKNLKEENKNVLIDSIFKEQKKIYHESFNNFKIEDYSKKKKLILNFGNKTLTNRNERGNILTYDYEKGGKIIMYMFSNPKLYPIDMISIKKKKEKIRTINDINVDFGLYSRKPELLDSLGDDDFFFFPFYMFDLNVYDIDIYLKEMYYFFYYMTFSLFFKENDKFKNYYKSLIVDVDNLTNNLNSDSEIRNNIKYMLKGREWYNLGKSLKNVIPGNIDTTYYYCFYSIKRKLYPCYLEITQVKEKEKEIEVTVNLRLSENGLSHNLILSIFKKVGILEQKSFIYENLQDFNVQKDVSFVSYENMKVINEIIKSNNLLFN